MGRTSTSSNESEWAERVCIISLLVFMECACLFEIVSIARQFRQIEANATIKLINLNKFTLFDVIKSTILSKIYVLRLFISGWIHGVKFLVDTRPTDLRVQHFGIFLRIEKAKRASHYTVHINYVFFNEHNIVTGLTEFFFMHIQINYCQVIIFIWLFDIGDN